MHKTAMILGVMLPLNSYSMADQGTRLRVTVSIRSIHALKQISEAGGQGQDLKWVKYGMVLMKKSFIRLGRAKLTVP
jgi:hypothetical protein